MARAWTVPTFSAAPRVRWSAGRPLSALAGECPDVGKLAFCISGDSLELHNPDPGGYAPGFGAVDLIPDHSVPLAWIIAICHVLDWAPLAHGVASANRPQLLDAHRGDFKQDATVFPWKTERGLPTSWRTVVAAESLAVGTVEHGRLAIRLSGNPQCVLRSTRTISRHLVDKKCLPRLAHPQPVARHSIGTASKEAGRNVSAIDAEPHASVFGSPHQHT